MRTFDYLEPATIAEACEILAARGAAARPLAGATDLMVQMEGGRLRPEALVYLGRIPELHGIDFHPQTGLRVGAMASLRELELHPAVRERYPALCRSAAEVGSVQIRNLATLAGNLCNASPSADTSPAVLAADAEIEIAGPTERRRVPVGEFWTGPGRTVLRPDEIVVAIHLPPPGEGHRSFYRKVAVRKAMDLAMVGICVTATTADGGVPEVRIALGAVAPVCLRAREAEVLARESGGDPARLAAAAEAAVAATSPISDQRASAGYRRELVRNLTRRGLTQVLAPAGGPPA